MTATKTPDNEPTIALTDMGLACLVMMDVSRKIGERRATKAMLTAIGGAHRFNDRNGIHGTRETLDAMAAEAFDEGFKIAEENIASEAASATIS
jgi:hypothetical protein